MSYRRTPLNMLFSLILCAFFLFLVYDVGMNGGAYTLMTWNIAKRYFMELVNLIERLGDKFVKYRYVP